MLVPDLPIRSELKSVVVAPHTNAGVGPSKLWPTGSRTSGLDAATIEVVAANTRFATILICALEVAAPAAVPKREVPVMAKRAPAAFTLMTP